MFRYFTYISCCCFLWTSCEKPTDLDFSSPIQRLVIQSNFSPNHPVEVFVSRSEVLSTSNADFVAIGNANVEIFQNKTLLEELEFLTGNYPNGSFYRSRAFQPEVGIEYMMRVSAPGFSEVTAVNKIPMPVRLTKLEVGQIETVQVGPNNQSLTFSADVEFVDPAEEENFYHLVFSQQKIFANGDMEPQTSIMESPLIIETMTNTNSFKTYYRGGILISDEGHNGQLNRHQITFRTFLTTENESLGKLIVELRTVSKDYFSYHSSLNNKNASSGAPVDEPVIIFNNIDEGYGIFAGYSISADSIAVIQ